MMTTESQNIRVYTPRSTVFGAVFIGIICLFIGIACLFLPTKEQFPVFLASFLFILAGLWSGLFFTWKLVRDPALMIDGEGIRNQHPLSRFHVKWDEIDAIYRIYHGTAFAIDLSPTGILSYFSRQGGRIPRWLDTNVPQQILVIRGNQLSLPIDQLLVQISEKFSVQLECYNIDLDDGRKEEQEPE